MTFLLFLVVLSGLVLIHELGHYLTARLFGVKAKEFGFGFPPRLIGFVRVKGKWKHVGLADQKEYDRTIWSLNWLPLGGFVRIKGEQEDGIHDADSLLAKPIWQRVLILAAGVIMNWLTAIVLFTIIFSVGAVAMLEGLPDGAQITNRSIAVSQVLKGSPAEQSGIQPGDDLIALNGTTPANAEAARNTLHGAGVTTQTVSLKRHGSPVELQVTPRMLQEINATGIGVALDDVGMVRFSLPRAIVISVEATAGMTKAVVFALGDVVRDLVMFRKVSEDVSGPVGIAVMTGEVAKQGIMPLLQLAAMLSINLAVINFLPIPALDGGRVLFLAIEKIRRRPMNHKLEAGIHNIVFLLLIILILLVTARDLSHYGGQIVGGMKGLVGM